ncbi:MAG: hypothetical protein IIW53_05990 [Rikenellaceae bacterium]|nr:hypothetical protein [Rikenellaceae bacterium]MBQ5853627.1 hypothetical protein [Rikenellaceae bacterium]
MKRILLIFTMLCVCNISYAQLVVKDNSNTGNVIAAVFDGFQMGKYDETYVLCINCTATTLGVKPNLTPIVINLGKGKDNAIQSVTLLLKLCKENTIQGTTITDHEGKTLKVSSLIFPDSPSIRRLQIETDEFLHSCTMTEDALQMLLNKLNNE